MWCVGRDSQHDLGVKPPTFGDDGDGGEGGVAGYGAGGVGGGGWGAAGGVGAVVAVSVWSRNAGEFAFRRQPALLCRKPRQHLSRFHGRKRRDRRPSMPAA